MRGEKRRDRRQDNNDVSNQTLHRVEMGRRPITPFHYLSCFSRSAWLSLTMILITFAEHGDRQIIFRFNTSNVSYKLGRLDLAIALIHAMLRDGK